MDIDDDGRLSADEYRTGRSAMLDRYFASLDRNADGYLVPAELLCATGSCDGEHEDSFRAGMALPADAPRIDPAEEGGFAKAGAKKMGREFGDMDRDGDGRVSRAEYGGGS